MQIATNIGKDKVAILEIVLENLFVEFILRREDAG